MLSSVWELATPKNISYIWGIGRLLGIIITLQIFSGLLLSLYYVRGSLAWNSLVEIRREVYWGWLLRLIHRNGASYVFIILFLHFFRGLLFGSFYLKWVWLRGWVIFLLTITAAFLGYVLPWGQISFWGATVIINLLRVLPIGKSIVTWLWGGFYVSIFTCRFFFTLHFIIPLIILLFVGRHLILLHFRGRSSPRGIRISIGLKLKFEHLFTFKDVAGLLTLWTLWTLCLFRPDWSADPVNFIISELSSSPLHIQPEWYFLHFYAILRSIPNKLGGLLGFAAAFILLVVLSVVLSIQALAQFSFYKMLFWLFFFVNIILIWLGRQAVEAPFVKIGQILTLAYFIILFLIISIDLLNYTITWRIFRTANSSIKPSN